MELLSHLYAWVTHNGTNRYCLMLPVRISRSGNRRRRFCLCPARNEIGAAQVRGFSQGGALAGALGADLQPQFFGSRQKLQDGAFELRKGQSAVDFGGETKALGQIGEFPRRSGELVDRPV